MTTRLKIIRLGVFTGLLGFLIGCAGDDTARRAENCAYLQHTLGDIVLAFQQKHGQLPETFDEAHTESGVVLPNRGDKFGQPLTYQKTAEDAFYFLSYGPDGQPDDGQDDDLKVEYQNGWLTSCEE